MEYKLEILCFTEIHNKIVKHLPKCYFKHSMYSYSRVGLIERALSIIYH